MLQDCSISLEEQKQYISALTQGNPLAREQKFENILVKLRELEQKISSIQDQNDLYYQSCIFF